MNDQFLYELRETPPVAFAVRLKRQLDREPVWRPRIIKLLLAVLAFGTAFALIHGRGKHDSPRPTTVSALHDSGRVHPVPGPGQERREMAARASLPSNSEMPQSTSTTSSSALPSKTLVPMHWRMADLRGLPISPADYQFASDSHNVWNGSASAFLRVTDTRERNPEMLNAANATCIVQAARASSFRGKRVQLSAHFATEADSRAGMLFWTYDAHGNAQGLNTGPGLHQSWTELSLVMMIPADAATMLYGGCLLGRGSMWIDSFSLEAVGSDVPLSRIPTMGPPAAPGQTSFLPQDSVLREPTNLDFEDTTPWTPDFMWEAHRRRVSSFVEH